MTTKESNKFEQAYELIEAAKANCKNDTSLNRLDYIQLHYGYCEPDYENESDYIATGDWNNISKYNEETRNFDVLDNTLPEVAKKLEELGFELEWEDEWTECSECNKLVRTNPSSYGWQQSYVHTDDGPVCFKCIDPVDHLSSLEGEITKCNTIKSIDPSKYGYVLVKDKFEHGFHRGQDADPKLIGAALKKQGINRFLFNLDSVGQFDIRFSVYVHESEIGLLNEESFQKENTDGPSVSAAMERGLKEASVKMNELSGDGIKYASVDMDGAEVRMVSPEEFVNGIKK